MSLVETSKSGPPHCESGVKEYMKTPEHVCLACHAAAKSRTVRPSRVRVKRACRRICTDDKVNRIYPRSDEEDFRDLHVRMSFTNSFYSDWRPVRATIVGRAWIGKLQKSSPET